MTITIVVLATCALASWLFPSPASAASDAVGGGGAVGASADGERAAASRSGCASGKYCRQHIAWHSTQCAHTYVLSKTAPEYDMAKGNMEVDAGPLFEFRARQASSQPLCALFTSGTWQVPIEAKLLSDAADYFWKRNPQTDCTIDELETLGTMSWEWDANYENDTQRELRIAELRHSKCSLLRLTDPFDVLAHLHSASRKSVARREATMESRLAPRIDLVGDESHRALFFRIVSFFRRQPYSLDFEVPKAERLTYTLTTHGDEVHGIGGITPIGKETKPQGSKLFELNFFFFPDDADEAHCPALEKALPKVSEGITSGATILAVLGVAYQPSHGCTVDSKQFASGTLRSWKAIHDVIENVMPLDPVSGLVLRNATGVTIISKGAYVPDIRRGDFVPKRNSHGRNFMNRHRRPFHSLYLPHFATEEHRVPVHHSHRRIGFIDLHRQLKPWPHHELEHKSYGDPARAHSACIVTAWTPTQGGELLRKAGNCRDWHHLGVFQLMLTYVNAGNPQW